MLCDCRRQAHTGNCLESEPYLKVVDLPAEDMSERRVAVMGYPERVGEDPGVVVGDRFDDINHGIELEFSAIVELPDRITDGPTQRMSYLDEGSPDAGPSTDGGAQRHEEAQEFDSVRVVPSDKCFTNCQAGCLEESWCR